MNGTVDSNVISLSGGQKYYMSIDWNASYNLDTMTATVTMSGNIKRYPSDTATNYIYDIYGSTNDNYININNINVFSTSSGGSGTKANPYRAYTRHGSLCDLKAYYYSNHTRGAGYVYGYGTLFTNYTFTVPINDDGYCTFTINAKGYCSAGTMLISNVTVSTTPTEVNSKLGYKTGGSWTGNGRIWHKENGTWVKKFLYRKESGSWTKK